MAIDRTSALKTAEILLQIKAIQLQPETPFTWASGWKSPIYCDNRVLLSYPEHRRYVQAQLAEVIQRNYGRPDLIAGVATGAVAIGALVADLLELPFVYVRPEAKEHGRKNQVEGHLGRGMHTVVVEDLVSTGNSSLRAVGALREAGAHVEGMVAIFTYGFPQAEAAFAQAECRLETLSDYTHLLEQAVQTSFIRPEELELLATWRKAPSEWTGVPLS